MGIITCDGCWDNPCTCGLEARRIAALRAEFAAAFPPSSIPAEEWDFPTTQEMLEHPDFAERQEWRRSKAMKSAD